MQAETGRIYSICYSEHFETRSTVKAGELVAAGAIGEVIHVTGSDRTASATSAGRPGSSTASATAACCATSAGTSASSSCSSPAPLDAEVISATVANRAHPETPGLQDVGDMHLTTPNTTGYVRVDWFTPGRPADLGRRAPDHPRHRGLYRAAQVRRHRRPRRAPTTCSWSTARACSASTAPASSCPTAGSSSPTCSTARKPRCRRRAASRRWRWR